MKYNLNSPFAKNANVLNNPYFFPSFSVGGKCFLIWRDFSPLFVSTGQKPNDLYWLSLALYHYSLWTTGIDTAAVLCQFPRSSLNGHPFLSHRRWNVLKHNRLSRKDPNLVNRGGELGPVHTLSRLFHCSYLTRVLYTKRLVKTQDKRAYVSDGQTEG